MVQKPRQKDYQQFHDIIQWLEDNGIKSFKDWAQKDLAGFASAKSLGRTTYKEIAMAMKWEYSVGDAQRLGVANIVATWSSQEIASLIKPLIKGNALLELKGHPFYHVVRADKRSKEIRVHLELPETKSFSDLTPEEFVKLIEQKGIFSTSEIDEGMRKFMYQRQNAAYYILTLQHLIRVNRARDAHKWDRMRITRYEETLRSLGGEDRDKPGRHWLNRYMQLTAGKGLKGDPDLANYSNISQQAYRRGISQELFKAITNIFSGYFDSAPALVDYLYYWDDEELLELCSQFLITQTDLERLPGFFKMLFNRMIDDRIQGEPGQLEKNRKQLALTRSKR